MGRRTRFVFVLESVYHCSDKLQHVTNRLHLPWRERERARTTQISDALSLTTLLRRAALHPQTADKTLQHASQALVSTCRLPVDLLEENALQRSCAECGLLAPHLQQRRCTASPHPRQMSKTRKSAEYSGDAPSKCRIVVQPLGRV
jgi:hypothetical protein